MNTTTELLTVLSNDVGPRGRQGWTLTLAADPGPPVTVGYGDPTAAGPHFVVPRGTLTVSVGGLGQIATGAAIYMHAPLGTPFTFTEIPR